MNKKIIRNAIKEEIHQMTQNFEIELPRMHGNNITTACLIDDKKTHEGLKHLWTAILKNVEIKFPGLMQPIEQYIRKGRKYYCFNNHDCCEFLDDGVYCRRETCHICCLSDYIYYNQDTIIANKPIIQNKLDLMIKTTEKRKAMVEDAKRKVKTMESIKEMHLIDFELFQMLRA